jgi:hypothetical protein
MPHLMVVGGTGMLRGVALEFARRGWTVSVVGRRNTVLAKLAAQADTLPGRVLPLPADYTDPAPFASAIRERRDEVGAPSVVAAWIHVTAPDAPRLLAHELVAASGNAPVDFLHVLTRLRTADPRDRSVPIPFPGEADLRALPGLTYRQAVLGWIVEPSGSRWLTDDEIAGGVIAAIDSGTAITAIGQTDPIESSPRQNGPNPP